MTKCITGEILSLMSNADSSMALNLIKQYYTVALSQFSQQSFI